MNKEKQFEEKAKFEGVYEFKLYENQEDFLKGIVKKTVKIHNKMTNASLAVITGLVFNTGAQTAFGWLALGTSAAAVSASDTALGAELSTLGLSRAAATISRTTTTQTNDTGSLTHTWNITGTTTINEIAIFNASSVGVMLSRALSGAIAVQNTNVLTGTYTWQAVGN